MTENVFLTPMPKNEPQLFLARVGSVQNGKGATIQKDGETAPSKKFYKTLYGISLKANDRIVCAMVGGSYVIIGKLL